MSEDMVSRPHPDPKYHTRMPIASRAAQFAPFAALTGYEEAVKEAERLTDTMPELSEEERERLDVVMKEMSESKTKTAVITWYEPDAVKDGGKIMTKKCQFTKLDPYKRILLLSTGERLPLAYILNIDPSLY